MVRLYSRKKSSFILLWKGARIWKLLRRTSRGTTCTRPPPYLRHALFIAYQSLQTEPSMVANSMHHRKRSYPTPEMQNLRHSICRGVPLAHKPTIRGCFVEISHFPMVMVDMDSKVQNELQIAVFECWRQWLQLYKLSPFLVGRKINWWKLHVPSIPTKLYPQEIVYKCRHNFSQHESLGNFRSYFTFISHAA